MNIINEKFEKFDVCLVLVIADGVARADVLCMNGYNTEYACLRCCVQGVYDTDQKAKRFPIITNNEERTNSEWRHQLKTIENIPREELSKYQTYGLKPKKFFYHCKKR